MEKATLDQKEEKKKGEKREEDKMEVDKKKVEKKEEEKKLKKEQQEDEDIRFTSGFYGVSQANTGAGSTLQFQDLQLHLRFLKVSQASFEG